ncbi:MAG: hypothetical protein HDQ97_17910 [Lachnospiraceae bacterium]|nr:hypothetical protein [Lachnospiraceae bacterium]
MSEIPFNIMYGGSVFYPYHQNVLWTFLESLLLIILIEKCRTNFKKVFATVLSVGIIVLGFILGYETMVDYYRIGALTVLTFYFFRGQTWKIRLIQFICLYILNVKLLGGYYYTFQRFQYACYAFYPVHIIILIFLRYWLLK